MLIKTYEHEDAEFTGMAEQFLLLARLTVLLAALLLPASLGAAGLTLYSYQESSGQVVVVDSLTKVPPEYRDTVTVGFIPRFSGSSPVQNKIKKDGADAIAAPAPESGPVEIFNEVIDLDPGLKVKGPPPEIEVENPAVATATLLMEQLRLLQLNNERIHVQAVVRGVAHPIIRHLHLTNIRAIQGLPAPEDIAWQDAAVWKSKARKFIEQKLVLQYTLSRWIDQQSPAIVKDMPGLLARMRAQLADLEKDFAAALALEDERLGKR